MNTVVGLWESHWESHDGRLSLSEWHFTEQIFSTHEVAEAAAVRAKLTSYDIREYMVRQ